jgi:Rod binding domain-containing protein
MELSQLNTNFNLANAQSPTLNAQRSTVNGASTSLLSPERQKIKEQKAAEDFEAMFVQMSLKQMRPKMEDGLFNSGLAEDVFYQFLDEAVAKEIAKSPNNFGIADSVAKELPNYQE